MEIHTLTIGSLLKYSWPCGDLQNKLEDKPLPMMLLASNLTHRHSLYYAHTHMHAHKHTHSFYHTHVHTHSFTHTSISSLYQITYTGVRVSVRGHMLVLGRGEERRGGGERRGGER